VSFRTISAFNEHLKPTMGEIELLRLFALADEFKYMIVREVSQQLLLSAVGCGVWDGAVCLHLLF
jgi:preprotein translocase subunit Sec63